MILCKDKTIALNSSEIEQKLAELADGWLIDENNHLSKEYNFKNFIEAMEFASSIAHIAEKQYHHPDIHISWGKCVVTIWTHKINALTESDFLLASGIDNMIR